MIPRVAIVTDSTCCLPTELVKKYDITVIPLLITHDGKSYRDGVDITASEVYKIMRAKKNLPTTSTPSAGDFLNAFCRLSEKAEKILCITLTSLQSQTYTTALAAKEMAKEIIPNTVIEILDSRAAAGSLGFIVKEAAGVTQAGGDLDQAVEAAKSIMRKVNLLAMLDTLFYLARGGRIGRAAAWAGAMLNVKPIVGHSPAVGETVPVARPRTRARAIERMLEIMAEKVGNSSVHVMVHHTDEPEEGEKLKATIGSRFNCTELLLTEFTPLMGVHTGPGVLAMSFYPD